MWLKFLVLVIGVGALFGGVLTLTALQGAPEEFKKLYGVKTATYALTAVLLGVVLVGLVVARTG